MDYHKPPHHQTQVSAMQQVTELQEKIAVAEMTLNDNYLPIADKLKAHHDIVCALTKIYNSSSLSKEYYSELGYNPTYINKLEMMQLLQMEIKKHKVFIDTYRKWDK